MKRRLAIPAFSCMVVVLTSPLCGAEPVGPGKYSGIVVWLCDKRLNTARRHYLGLGPVTIGFSG